MSEVNVRFPGNIPTVDDRTALRRLVSANLQGDRLYIALGGRQRGDGLGGAYVWMGGDQGVDDDGATVKPNDLSPGQKGRFKFVGSMVATGNLNAADQAYLNGVLLQAFQAVDESEQSVALAQQAVQDAINVRNTFPNYFKGDTGAPGAAGNVATRAQLKTLNLNVGDVWEMVDGAKSGLFDIIAAPPAGTADPDEGLYIPLANGRWAKRRIVAMFYSAGWWGIGDGFVDTVASVPVYAGISGTLVIGQSRTFYYMANILPSGATIQLPPGVITVAGFVEWGRALAAGQLPRSVHVRGVKGETVIKGIGAARTGGNGFFHINGSNSDVAGCVFRDLRTTDGQISAAGIVFAGGVFPERQGDNGVKNIGFWDCEFYNMTAPSIVYGSDWSRTDPNGMQRTRGVRIYNNVIRNCDQEYQSLYGVEDVWYHDNDVECDWIGVAREFYGFRCGAKNVHIFNNRIIGPVGYPRDDARAFNIKSMIGPLTPPNTNILATSEIHIYNNDVQNWPLFTQIAGIVDRVYIHNNIAINSPLPTKTNQQATFIALDDNIDIGLVIVHDNVVQGYDAAYYVQFGFVRDFRFLRNNFKGAGNRPDTQPGTGVAAVFGSDIGFLQVIGNTFESPNTFGSVVRFTNTPATFFAQVYDNVGPESFYAVGDSRYPTMVGFSGGTAMGKVQTSPGGPLYDATTAPIPSQIPNGTNGLAAPGTWAALTRDPNPAVYP
jgi:hypothetical protein